MHVAHVRQVLHTAGYATKHSDQLEGGHLPIMVLERDGQFDNLLLCNCTVGYQEKPIKLNDYGKWEKLQYSLKRARALVTDKKTMTILIEHGKLVELQ